MHSQALFGPKYPSVGTLLQYERLPEFCYMCGLVGHRKREYPHNSSWSYELNVQLPYGPWLRAEDDRVALPLVYLLINFPNSPVTPGQLVGHDEALSSGSSSMHPPRVQLLSLIPRDLTGHKRSSQIEGCMATHIDMAIDDSGTSDHHIIKRRSVKIQKVRVLVIISTRCQPNQPSTIQIRRWLLYIPAKIHEYPLLECPGTGGSPDIQPLPDGNQEDIPKYGFCI